MLSGVGPADHLKEHAIDVVQHLPGVGENLQVFLIRKYYIVLKPVIYDLQNFIKIGAKKNRFPSKVCLNIRKI